MFGVNDPHALCNIKKGDSPGSISGAEFLQKYHKCTTRFRQGNEGHPLRMAEQADARAIWKARQPVEPEIKTATATPKKKRVKREPKRPDADGVYRL